MGFDNSPSSKAFLGNTLKKIQIKTGNPSVLPKRAHMFSSGNDNIVIFSDKPQTPTSNQNIIISGKVLPLITIKRLPNGQMLLQLNKGEKVEDSSLKNKEGIRLKLTTDETNKKTTFITHF